MWESLAISKGGGKRGKPVFGFPRFPRPVISTAFRLPSRMPGLGIKTSKQIVLGLLHAAASFGITHVKRHGFQSGDRLAGAQVRGGIGDPFEDLPGSGKVGVASFFLALGVGCDFHLSTRTVKVHIRIEVIAEEVMDGGGVLGLDVEIAHVLADDRAVLCLH